MKHIIWTSEPDYKNWKEDLEVQYPKEEGFTEDFRISVMYEINDGYFEDELITLSKELGNNIVMIADLGLWNGRKSAYKVLQSTDLNCFLLSSCGEYVTFYIDDDEVKCRDIHHDGTNVYTYRKLKDNITKFDFEEYVYETSLNKAIEDYTEPIGHYVAEIYGLEEQK